MLYEIYYAFREINKQDSNNTSCADIVKYYDQLLCDLRYAKFMKKHKN